MFLYSRVTVLVVSVQGQEPNSIVGAERLKRAVTIVSQTSLKMISAVSKVTMGAPSMTDAI